MRTEGFIPRVAALAALLATIGAAGCATVQPWQRGRLADPCMIFDADASASAYAAHWQEAREAASGGFGVQAGGCGCKGRGLRRASASSAGNFPSSGPTRQQRPPREDLVRPNRSPSSRTTATTRRSI